MRRHYGFFPALLTGLLICGCGQRGPLLLPGDRSQVHTELPEIDREAVEGALEDDAEEGTGEVPNTERPQSQDDEAEPFIDPASADDQ